MSLKSLFSHSNSYLRVKQRKPTSNIVFCSYTRFEIVTTCIYPRKIEKTWFSGLSDQSDRVSKLNKKIKKIHLKQHLNGANWIPGSLNAVFWWMRYVPTHIPPQRREICVKNTKIEVSHDLKNDEKSMFSHQNRVLAISNHEKQILRTILRVLSAYRFFSWAISHRKI